MFGKWEKHSKGICNVDWQIQATLMKICFIERVIWKYKNPSCYGKKISAVEFKYIR